MKRLTVIMLMCLLIVLLSPALSVQANEAEGTSFSDMLARAEAIVNYTWVPQQRIATWNENPYQGSMYFEKGQTVIGMPYTLFSWELGVDSLLSLEQFQAKVSDNYTASAYCNSVGQNRVGPAFGSCCATFVSEVFGGSFMQGSNPRYDSVQKIWQSEYGITTSGVPLAHVQLGDALSNTKGGHIIWVGEITDTYLTIYEQTPPVARKVRVPKNSVNADGYLVYNGAVYSTVTRSKELNKPQIPEDNRFDGFYPIKGYPCVEANFEVKQKDHTTRAGEIYTTDYCTIERIYADGWCRVTFPITSSGGTLSGYTPLSNFILHVDHGNVAYYTDQRISVYTRTDLAESPSWWIGEGDTFYVVSETDSAVQVLYPVAEIYGGGYKLGWIPRDALPEKVQAPVFGDTNGDGNVNLKDVMFLRLYIVNYDYETDTAPFEAGVGVDVNDDGTVNLRDVVALRRYIANMPLPE